MRLFSDYRMSAVLITTYSQTASHDTELKYATGFFYSPPDSELYLITNRHVVIDEETSYFPNLLRFWIHKDKSNLKANESISLFLYKNGEKVWLEHDNSQIDVVAIPISYDQFKNYFYYAFVPDDDMSSMWDSYRVTQGDDALVIGYPLKFSDRVYNLPVMRNCSIASAYPEPFEDNPYFWIDARLHDGMSGSPVVSKPRSMFEGLDRRRTVNTMNELSFLLGVLSQSTVKLALNKVYHAYLIKQIIAKRGKSN